MALVVIIYGQTATFQFLRYDDHAYVLDNPMVRQGLGVAGALWALTSFDAANWHPITWLSHMLDVTLFGLDPGAHHLVNMAWHLGNAWLLLAAMVGMTGARWPSLVVALLFAVHPLHVESVAWIAERKDLVSTFWGLAGILAYCRYARQPRLVRYGAVAACHALSLMAKPMLVTLPLLLLVLDYWPLQRHLKPARAGVPRPWELVAEKLPLLVLSAASALVTILAQYRGGAVESLAIVPIGLRAANAALSYWHYIADTLWPAGLAVFYPLDLDLSPAKGVMAGTALAVAGIAAFRKRHGRPWLWAGWLWYLIALVPVIGLVQVGAQARADRYTYLPLVGVFLIVAWEGQGLWRRHAPARPLLVGLGTVAVLVLTLAAHHQTGFWKDGVSVFTRAVTVTGDNAFAHNNLGLSLADKGDLSRAIVHYRQALAINPVLAQAHNNLGLALKRSGDLPLAMDHFRLALSLRPDLAHVHVNLGLALGETARSDEAIGHLRQALALAPRLAQAHHGLAMVLADMGGWHEALPHFQAAVDAAGHDTRYRLHLGNALMQVGRLEQAVDQFIGALEGSPENTEVLNNLGVALARSNRVQQARACFQRVLDLDPANPDAKRNLDRVDRLQRGQSGSADYR